MTNLNTIILFCFAVFLLFPACHPEPMMEPTRIECTSVCDYLVLGHTYEEYNKVDRRIEEADLTKYAQIWLGGDICSETTLEAATLEYLDDLFDLSSDYTHWTVGNHDVRNGNTELITGHTNRPLYYAQDVDGITLIVLNTNNGNEIECDEMEQQYELIRAVCDTISESSHLVVLMHHIVWGFVESGMIVNAYANADNSWLSFTCQPPIQRFDDIIYPELLEVQERGIPVICISGDFGQNAASYEWVTTDGITFLGSGITSEIEWNEQWPTAGERDSVLVLHHDLELETLTWKFIDIEDM